MTRKTRRVPLPFVRSLRRCVSKLTSRQPATARAPALPTPDQIHQYVTRGLSWLTDPVGEKLPPIGSRGRSYAWYWGFWGRALVFAYQATRDERFLRLFEDGFERILALRDDRLGLVDAPQQRTLPGWGTDFEGVHANEITVAGLVVLPLCELLLLLDSDAQARAAFGRLAPRYAAVAEESVWQFERDYRLAGGAGYYVHPVTHAVEALNHAHAFGAACAHLFALTGEQRYRTKVEQLTAFFRRSITEEPGGTLAWPYEPRPDNMRDQPPEAIWKAATTLELPCAALRHGLAYDDRDVARFSASLLRGVLRPEGINRWMSGSVTQILGARYAGSSLPGQGLSLWFLMPDPDGGHRDALLARMAARPSLFPNGWFGGARGLLVAATWLMKEDRAVGRRH